MRLEAFLVTFLIPLAVLLLGPYLPQPGVDVERIVKVVGTTDVRQQISIFCLGIVPYLNASTAVELAALAVPRWRPLRHDWPAGRRKLLRASIIATAGFAALQAFFIARWLESSERLYASFGPLISLPPWPFHLTTIFTLTAAALVVVVLVRLIDRRGGVPGASAFILVVSVHELPDRLGLLSEAYRQTVISPSDLGMFAIAAAAVVGSTVSILRRRPAVDGAVGPAPVRQPVSGICPFEIAPVILMPATLLLFALAPAEDAPNLRLSLNLAVMFLLALMLPAFFYRPAIVARFLSAAGTLPSDVDPRYRDAQPLRGAIRRATPLSVVWLRQRDGVRGSPQQLRQRRWKSRHRPLLPRRRFGKRRRRSPLRARLG